MSDRQPTIRLCANQFRWLLHRRCVPQLGCMPRFWSTYLHFTSTQPSGWICLHGWYDEHEIQPPGRLRVQRDGRHRIRLQQHCRQLVHQRRCCRQVITFSDIPASAQNRSLGWAAYPGSKLTTEGEGSVSVFELDHLSTAPVTWNTLHASENNLIGKKVGSPAFTGWKVGNTEHDAGLVDCKSDMAFFNRIPEGKEGRVKVQHSGGSRWFLEFDC